MPFARSELLQNALLEEHPELAEKIQESRQRRIDSMRLGSRVTEDDEFLPRNRKSRSNQGDTLNPAQSRTLASPIQPPNSGLDITRRDLDRTKDDLQFTMDEEGLVREFPAGDSLSPHHVKSGAGDSRPPLTRTQSSEVEPNAFGPSSVKSDFSICAATSPNETVTQDENSFPSGKVWGDSLRTPGKTDLKDIMLQASSLSSSSKVSNLTTSLRAAAQPTSNAVVKVSQKERKRQQQEARLRVNLPPEPPKTSPGPSRPQVSPWQSIPSIPKSEIELVSRLEDASNPRTSSKSMTLRQSVSGSSREGVDSTSPQPVRSVSTPQTSQAAKPIPPQIQSIRHMPPPNRSTSGVDARTSMLDILSQQQTEKTAIKEAVAKRSLQDIQQEQEFQEWWDQESRRVQEEEAAAKSPRVPQGKGARGRGNRRKSGGRGGKATSEQATKESTQEPQVGNMETKPSRGERPSRSAGRGRGRRGRGQVTG